MGKLYLIEYSGWHVELDFKASVLKKKNTTIYVPPKKLIFVEAFSLWSLQVEWSVL